MDELSEDFIRGAVQISIKDGYILHNFYLKLPWNCQWDKIILKENWKEPTNQRVNFPLVICRQTTDVISKVAIVLNISRKMEIKWGFLVKTKPVCSENWF